jgi:hypothetical protein
MSYATVSRKRAIPGNIQYFDGCCDIIHNMNLISAAPSCIDTNLKATNCENHDDFLRPKPAWC